MEDKIKCAMIECICLLQSQLKEMTGLTCRSPEMGLPTLEGCAKELEMLYKLYDALSPKKTEE